MWHVLCRVVGVGTGFWYCMLCLVDMVSSTGLSYVYRHYMYMNTELINIQCAILYKYIYNSYSVFNDVIIYKIQFL